MSSAVLSPVLADRLVKRNTAVTDAALVLAGAAVVGLLAQVSVPRFSAPLGPAPSPRKPLGVLRGGAALGPRRGAASLLSYMLLGLVGMPWFAQFTGGLAAVAKPSFGYIIGFIPAAYLIGYLSERRWDRSWWKAVAGFGLASLIPFVFGVPYLWAVLALAGKNIGFAGAMAAGFTPFIIGGIVKWLLGAMLLPGAWKALEIFEDGRDAR